ncbi:Next to BRCA1 gene 1 protein [Lachnellula hyalina]|uniref:Next to BRCA1 gene 1 protein n=1 Tax=Lachnellula hyalina TaxID=1316788 RepID=A0A8H8R671_9HELO|nr:Next to BRCA1 gene 1 protein [Lachnellula hyalina]TVY28460.1 Next to BRCA1 gene 1 protein [Lachnellula hyalina]
MASSPATNPDTLVTLKVNVEGTNRRFKLPLRDLGASTLPDKLRFLLAVAPSSTAIFERYSDSAASFVVLDPTNASVYKQLYRAAKAKLKLRLKVTIIDHPAPAPKQATVEDEEPSPVSPVEEKASTQQAEVTPTPVLPSTDYSAVQYADESTRQPSVAEIQNRFEDLLLNHPRFTPKAPAPVVSSACCPMFPVHQERPKMSATSNTEIPITRGAAARDKWFAELAGVSKERQNAIRTHASAPTASSASIFSVYCNHCNDAIPDEHYHCSTCDDGDFDLCQNCVADGVLCGGDGHWMIKRFVKNGKVINSTTETIAPKPKVPAFSESKTTLVPEETKITPTRTCNSCIQELSVENFVTCTSCDDFDLCLSCHVGLEHGHHPKHAFAPAVEDSHLATIAQKLLAPGRNVGHDAVCDGCDKYIYGVRHKCLDCPDWDFCSTCVPNANFIHPNHRFVPIYESLSNPLALAKSYNSKPRHHGIYCDGPLCNGSNGHQTFIRGDRYKCAVCHDTDFCANCEASPSNGHNRTHPLIKFKTPVRNVSVTTLGDHEDGKPMPIMGDRRPRLSKATETTPAQSANAATQVQTVADLQPTEPVKPKEFHEFEAEKPVEVKTEEVKELSAGVAEEDLVAHFVRDVIADGTILPPNSVFEQTWYLRNGGNTSWPAGCSVKFVGGDNMCAVDPAHPASVHELVSAAESTTCYTEVAPGQEAGFTVLMRTPNRDGNFISYWRLTGPDGGKFGHRLWCDVTVKDPVVKQEPKEEVSEASGSQMIFPKLENESPATSMHEEASSAVPETEDEDEFEDFVEETLGDDETEDGFLTDEEYDILDASDEEYLAEQEKAIRK